MNRTQNYWRKCSTCKNEIALGAKYYECSVSTCTGTRTGYVFCSVSCWEVHLPGAKHRDAGAIEKKAPMTPHQDEAAVPKRILISSSPTTANVPIGKSSMSNEVLVVVSKMKQFIRDISDMNTSEDVNHVLSEMIRQACEKAIVNARADGRKTLMARDFK